jgi:hypothetical protein
MDNIILTSKAIFYLHIFINNASLHYKIYFAQRNYIPARIAANGYYVGQ